MCPLYTQIRQSKYSKQDYDCQEHEDRVGLTLLAPGVEHVSFVRNEHIQASCYSCTPVFSASTIQDVNLAETTLIRILARAISIVITFIGTVFPFESNRYKL